MARFLLTHLTEALAKSPDAKFSDADLISRAEAGEIEGLIKAKILIPSQERARSDRGRVSYRVDVGVIATAISTQKKLKAPASPVRLDPRLLFLGTSAIKGELYAWFLVFAEEDEAIAALLERKGRDYTEADRIVAVTAREPVARMKSRTGLRLKLEFVTLGELGVTGVRSEAVRRKTVAAPTTGVATSKLEEEIASFPSRKRIEIPGTWAEGVYSKKKDREPGATLNSFKVGGNEISLGDTLFLLLLRCSAPRFG